MSLDDVRTVLTEQELTYKVYYLVCFWLEVSFNFYFTGVQAIPDRSMWVSQPIIDIIAVLALWFVTLQHLTKTL